MIHLLERLIPDSVSLRSEESRRRGRLIVYATLFAVLTPLPVAWILLLIGDSATAEDVLWGMLPSAFTLAMLRLTGSTQVTGHYLTGWVFLQTALDFGHDNGFSVLAIFAIPILSCALISERAGIAWTLASVAWVVSIGLQVAPDDPLYFGLIWSAAVVVGVVGFAVIVLEVTRTRARLEAEQAHQELLTQRERLRAFAENAFPAIAEATAGQTLFASPGVQTVLGYKPDQFSQKPLADYVHPDELKQILDDLSHVSAQGLRCEARLRHAEGHWVWLEVYAIPYGPGTDRWIFAARNIDDEVNRRDALQQAQRLESVGVLAAGMAHDFNNLLTVSMGFSEMLPLSEERDGLIHATQEAAKLTRQLLTFARVDGVGPAAVEVTELLEGLKPMLRSVLGPAIELQVEATTGPVAAAISAGHLHQIVINLCTNAREAMPDGGHLRIHVDQVLEEQATANDAGAGPLVKEWIDIVVEDDGIGMSPHVQQHAFDPFFTTKESSRGSGLGLASVYGILNNCGGVIRINSREGLGTSVRVQIPRAREQAVRPKVYMDLDPEPALGENHSVLVVEDDISVRSVIGHALERAGYVVEYAANGYEGLALINTFEPDLIVSDLVMGGLGGVDFVARVRRTFPTMRVLFTSGYSHLHEEQWEQEGHTLFLAKPFRSSDLLMSVRRLLTPPRRAERNAEAI